MKYWQMNERFLIEHEGDLECAERGGLRMTPCRGKSERVARKIVDFVPWRNG